MPRKSILALCAALTLAACSSGPASGVVLDKEYRPAYSTTTFISTGKSMVPVVTVIPACWEITVPDGTACISAGTWTELEIGDFYEASNE